MTPTNLNKVAFSTLAAGKLTGIAALGMGYLRFPGHFAWGVVLFVVAFVFLAITVGLCMKASKLHGPARPEEKPQW